MPIIDSICFSMMNGESEVIGLSSLLEITKILQVLISFERKGSRLRVVLRRVERQKSFSRGHGDEFFHSIAMHPTFHGALQGDV